MQQYQGLAHRQQQKLGLILTPRMIQAIRILAMPVEELRLTIAEELEKNLALEITEDPTLVSYDRVAEPEREYSVYKETSDPGYTRTRRDREEAGNLKRQFLEGALSRPESLEDHLIWQLRLEPLKEREFEIGETLIRNLDANGFHLEPQKILFRKRSC